MTATVPFTFLDPGRLVDDELELIMVCRYPGDPKRGYVPAYQFDMRVDGALRPAGHLDLRIGDSPSIQLYAGHIGYHVVPVCRGHHYALRACRLVMPLARAHGINPVWITCNPDNIPSRRTCELLGAELIEIVDLPSDHEMYLNGERQKCWYCLEP